MYITGSFYNPQENMAIPLVRLGNDQVQRVNIPVVCLSRSYRRIDFLTILY